MAFLDSTVYDLTTSSGQTSALSDIIDEMNSSSVDSELLNYFNIMSYGKIDVFEPSHGLGTNIFTVSKTHGLNYRPAFVGFYGNNTDPNNIYYEALPIYGIGFNFITMKDNLTNWRMYVDSQSVYAEVHDPGIILPAPLTNTYHFFYYIFALPMPT